MTLEQIKAMSAADDAEHLAEYNKYRRGRIAVRPVRPREFGAIIDRAVEILKEMK
jgi:hypothetical protein